MRIAFIVLLLANLGFMAWAVWVDTPPPTQTSESTARLPRLKLVTEATPPRAQGAGNPATANKVSAMPPAGGASASPAVDVSKLAGSRDGAAGALNATEPTAQIQRCVSVGPFNDLTAVTSAAAALRSRGFAPQQRTEEGNVPEGYWVSIGGVDSADKADRILKALDKGGFKDARLMPDDGDGRRISVGLFGERERAERRAKAVQKLGLKAQVAQRTQPGMVYWMDLALKQSDGSVSAQDLLAHADTNPDSGLTVQACAASVAAKPVNSDAPSAGAAPATTRVPPSTVAGTPQLKEAR